MKQDLNQELTRNIKSDIPFGSVLHLPHCRYFKNVFPLEQQAEELRKKVALLNDIFGFTARHYINEKGAMIFIFGLHVAIVRDGWKAGSNDLINEIINFVEKYNQLEGKTENQ